MKTKSVQSFKIKNNKIEKKLSYIQKTEKEVQNFCENNLEDFLNLKFIKTQFSFDGGIADTLAVDYEYNPVIIEYKKSYSSSVLLQAVFYKKCIEKNWTVGYYTVLKKLGQEVANKVNWKNIKIIIIAGDFDKWTLKATDLLNNVNLYKYRFFEDSFICEHVYAPKSVIENDYKKNHQKYSGKNLSIPLIKEADFSREEKVINKKGKVIKTCLYYYNFATEKIRIIFNKIENKIENLFSNCQKEYTANYWYFKAERKFVEFYFRKDAIFIQIQLIEDQKSDVIEIEDVTKKGTPGSLKRRIKIIDDSKLEELIRLIKLSYDNVGNHSLSTIIDSNNENWIKVIPIISKKEMLMLMGHLNLIF